MSRFLVIYFFICLASIFAHGSISPSTTQPVIEQTDVLLGELDSADPRIRDRACERLMGLDPDLLPELRRKLERLEIISIAQSVALKEIVTHVYMTTQHNFQGEIDPI